MPPKKTKNDSKIDSKKESKKTSKKTSKPKKEPKPKKTSKPKKASKPKKESTSKKTSKPKKESKSKNTSKNILETTEETTEDSFKESSEKESQEEVYSEDLNIGSETELKDCELEDSVDDDDDFLDGDESSEINENSEVKFVLGDDRKTNPRLTRYEMVRILGERIKQLTMGAKPLVKNVQDITYDQIALEELKLNMIPFKIKRPLPNNKVEIWDINELNKKHLISLLN